MKQIESRFLRDIIGGYGIGGGVETPKDPPREAKVVDPSYDPSYTPPKTEEGN
tara:strand:- start:856 stop:1014 length:159 start_codon:yes stop_codon:yes gene_type:complete